MAYKLKGFLHEGSRVAGNDLEYIQTALDYFSAKEGIEGYQMMRHLVDKTFGRDQEESSRPRLLEVVDILSGPNKTVRGGVGHEAVTAVLRQKLEHTDAFHESIKNKIVITARCVRSDFIRTPNRFSKEQDYLRRGTLGVFLCASTDSKFNNLRPGAYVWGSLRGQTVAALDGGFAGTIFDVATNVGKIADAIEEYVSSVRSFNKKCKTFRQFEGPTAKLFVGSTLADPNPRSSPISKFKTVIKTGLYGNGTPQTKYHFNHCLLKSEKSYNFDIVGPAPAKENAFIWIGHLRNNGFLDVLDRPIGLGRETIIYAPMTLNISVPIEIKYYFHDKAGFGHAWINGPNTSVSDSINNVQRGGNDFKDVIGPAIKDLIKQKRNFILVIPEMAYSRGFSTNNKNISRIQTLTDNNLARSTDAAGKQILRVVIPPETVPAVKTYLRKLPAEAVVEYGVTTAAGGGTNNVGGLQKKQASLSNLTQKTHFRERETVTFDGSYTGGNFGDFHVEVLEVLDEHLGSQVSQNIDFVSIVAHGMGAINLASIVKNMPNSSVHRDAEVGFKSVPIKRIDFVEDGTDSISSYPFAKHTPSYTVYEDYLLAKSEEGSYFEFNYITEAGTQAGTEFFNKIDASLQFTKNNKPESSLGEAFTIPINGDLNLQSNISMHAIRPTRGDISKVLYAFPMETTATNSIQGQSNKPLYPKLPDTTIALRPGDSLVPDHAGAMASTPSEGKLNQYSLEQNNLKNLIDNFSVVLNDWKNMDESEFCQANPTYCKILTEGSSVTSAGAGTTINVNVARHFELSKIQNSLKKHYEHIQRYYQLKYLIQDEEQILEYINDKSALREYQKQRRKDLSDQNLKLVTDYDAFDPQSIIRIHFLPLSVLSAVGPQSATSGQFLGRPVPIDFATAKQCFTAEPLLMPQKTQIYPFGDVENNPGMVEKILEQLAIADALDITINRLDDAIERARPRPITQTPNCDEQPIAIRDLIVPSYEVSKYNTKDISATQSPCAGKTIRVVGDYAALKTMINWAPSKVSLISAAERFSTSKTDLQETLGKTNQFDVGRFSYKCRGPNNKINHKKSPEIWSCITDIMKESWEAACNVSGYVPFKITTGIKGYHASDTGVVALPGGLSIDAYGLSINVDPHLTGYSNDGDPIYSIFTGMWTPGFVEAYQDQLYDLGILDDQPFSSFGVSGRYLDNAYSGFTGRQRRLSQDWKFATDSYSGPAGAEEKEEGYQKIMRAAKNSVIVPPNANPLLWVLTFCERSGMKWGNGTFMKKRHRGTKRGYSIAGFDIRNPAPESWSLDEQNKIAAIYGIADVVARVNAISWPYDIDKHMHFQYYSGPPVIPWEDIQ